MEHLSFGFHGDPREQDQSEDEGFVYDPNEESLTEGSEYADDALRMVEQPFHQHQKLD